MLRNIGLFVLLGPALGFVTGFWVMLPTLGVLLGERNEINLGQLVLLPVAYSLGAIPAALTGLMDHLLRRSAWRVLWTTLIGFGLSFLPILTSLLMGFMHSPYVLLFGLIGAAPACVCSAVATRLEAKLAHDPART